MAPKALKRPAAAETLGRSVRQRAAAAEEAAPAAAAAAPASRAAPLETLLSASATGPAENGAAAGDLQAVLAPMRRMAAGADGDMNAAEQSATLRKVAEELMNRWTLWIGPVPHCITECEAYLHGPAHQDPYTHGDEGQQSCGVWYFHRKGGSFKAGSFKGLDLACGEAAAKVSAGLLLRAVRPLEPACGAPKKEVTEGPSVLVDRILKLNGKASIADFVAGRRASELSASTTEGLQLRPAEHPREEKLWRAPRVGLVLRGEAAGKTHMEGGRPANFIARFYRFSTAPAMLSKFRVGFALGSILEEGTAAADLVPVLGMRQLPDYALFLNQGREWASPAAYVDREVKKLAEYCEMIGACFAVSQ